MTTLFISDLHLDASAPAITEQFLDFLQGPAQACDALYILGDLFEVWVGDDDDDAHNTNILDAIRRVADRGTKVFFMHGNRDFMAGEQFAARAGLTMLADPTLVTVAGSDVLLSHGDQYCTDDVDYQAFRRQSRDPAWQRQMLALPLPARRQLAASMREQSEAAMQGKSAQIMDVNHDAIDAALVEHDVATLLHGHTHRPAVHRFSVGDRAATRIVLGDWYDQASYLRWDSAGARLSTEQR